MNPAEELVASTMIAGDGDGKDPRRRRRRAAEEEVAEPSGNGDFDGKNPWVWIIGGLFFRLWRSVGEFGRL